jgi:hypothetical protein
MWDSVDVDNVIVFCLIEEFFKWWVMGCKNDLINIGPLN